MEFHGRVSLSLWGLLRLLESPGDDVDMMDLVVSVSISLALDWFMFRYAPCCRIGGTDLVFWRDALLDALRVIP